MADEEQENDEEQEQKDVIDRQIRTHKALQYMERELLLPSATVMPVLLNLLKAYDGNWQFIEEDNYNVLVDTVFTMQELDEAEKAPGSSSGGARKSAKRERKPSGVATTRGRQQRRAPRNSKRPESDENSDENDDGSQELVRRIRGRAPAGAAGIPARCAMMPSASSNAKLKAPWDADDDPAWEPLLALPMPLPPSAAPQCQLQLQSGGVGRRELRRLSTRQPVRDPVTAVNKQTQTEAPFFNLEASYFNPEAIQAKEPIQPTALICYEEIPAELPAPEKKLPACTAIVKQEKKSETEPVFLSDFEVRRQILNQVATPRPCAAEICSKCEKPRPLRFDPSKVKLEHPRGAAAGSSGKDQAIPSTTIPMGCLNPEPLQMALPLALAAGSFIATEDEDHRMEVNNQVTDPEPLLLTFPATTDQAPTTKAAEPVVKSLGIPEHMQELVPCSEKPAIEEAAVVLDVSCRSSSVSDCQPVLVPVKPDPEVTVVEYPLMESRLSSEVEVKEVSPKIAFECSAIFEGELQQQPSGAECENSTAEGALAALASYTSESDEDMQPELESQFPSSVPAGHSEEVINNASSCCLTEREKTDAHEEARGILPLANTSSVAELHEGFQSPRVENPTAESGDPIVIVEANRTLLSAITQPQQHEEASSEAGEGDTKDTEMAPTEDTKQSSEGGTSAESSKKRKRALIKLKDLEEQSCHALDHIPERQSRHDHRDISRGKEKVPIPLYLDPSGAIDLPPDFLYITSSVVSQSAHVQISMARVGEDDRCSGCVGNCLDNRVPCECARLTDGEYAYTVEGCLYPHFLQQELERKRNLSLLAYCQPGACPVERTNDEVCKGHVQRRFIKECWEKCGCNQLCGNRIVQRGVVHRLQVFWTESGKGWGIRTLERLCAGTFVCEYVGEILTNTEMWHCNNDVHMKAKHHYSLQLDADWCSERYLKDEEALCLDATYFGNVARFINHRCIDTNLIEIPVEIESPDHHYYHLAFFTSKDVSANEELTWDYGLDFSDKDHQIQAFECLCGSTFCRGKMEGKPWV